MKEEQYYIGKMDAHIDEDTESRHCYFDDILLEIIRDLGYNDVVKLYKSVNMWYA